MKVQHLKTSVGDVKGYAIFNNFNLPDKTNTNISLSSKYATLNCCIRLVLENQQCVFNIIMWNVIIFIVMFSNIYKCMNIAGGSECVTGKPLDISICERRGCERNTCFERRLL